MLVPTIVVESTDMEAVLSIGQAARLAGVSVQTLRHYDKLRLLPPSHVSTAGHRRYSARDCERLRLIRALREVGFDLDTIRQVLDRELEPQQAVDMRFEALEAEQRTLNRRRLVLRAAMTGNRNDVLDRLHAKHVLAKLDRLEREALLARHLGWAPRDTPASEAVWRAATRDLPEEMDDAQLEAWLELAEIAADEGFHETLERQFALGRAFERLRCSERERQFPASVGPRRRSHSRGARSRRWRISGRARCLARRRCEAALLQAGCALDSMAGRRVRSLSRPAHRPVLGAHLHTQAHAV